MRRTVVNWRETTNSNGTRRARLRTEFENVLGWPCSACTPRIFPESAFRTPRESIACSSALTRTAEESKDPQVFDGAINCWPPSAPMLAIS
jgi:hypothetical protein